MYSPVSTGADGVGADAAFFEQRWIRAGGAELALPAAVREYGSACLSENCFPLAARQVAISETRAQTLIPVLKPVCISGSSISTRSLSRNKMIYMENQYFTSQAVYQALRDRMTDHDPALPADGAHPAQAHAYAHRGHLA